MTDTTQESAEAPPAAIICSFCQKPSTEVGTLVAGAGVFICDSCVALCADLIDNKSDIKPKVADWAERLSDEDLLAMLPRFVAAGLQVDRQLAIYVGKARSRGITWTRIGAVLGMTRQSAWERFSGEE